MILKKVKIFEKKVKITKRKYAFKCYPRILDSFNGELQLKDTEPMIKTDKIIDSVKRF